MTLETYSHRYDPDEEFETMGAKVLAIEPRVALALERNRLTRVRLQDAGVVLTYAGGELSKGHGARPA